MIRNILKHLMQLEEPKIRVEKRFTLEKFRRFLVPEEQDYYQCPSADDTKLSKETSLQKSGICSCLNSMIIIIVLINNNYI